MRYNKAAAVLLFGAGPALAFQLQPKNGWRRNVVSGSKIKLPTTSIYANGFADDSDTATVDTAAAPSSATSAFDEMLEKFALPLEFKSTKDNAKVDAVADKVDEQVDDSTSSKSSSSGTATVAEKSTASADNSKAATNDQKVDDKKEQAAKEETKAAQKVDDKKVQAAKEAVKKVQAAKDAVQKVDVKKEQATTEVIQKVDVKKEQVAKEEAKAVQKVDDKKEEATKEVVQKVADKKEQAAKDETKAVQKVDGEKEEAKVVQKVADKKEQIAKEEAKVVQKVDEKKEQAIEEAKVMQKVDDKKEQVSKQEEATPAPTAAFGPIVTPRRAFSDFGAPQRSEPKIKWDFGEDTRMKPTALGVNPNRKTEVVKMEEPEPEPKPIVKQQQSPVTKKEVETPSVTETKTVTKTSDVPAKDTAKSVATDEKSSVLKPAPSTEIAPSSTSSDLIQSQPISLPSINLPESLRNMNLEDPGIIASGTVVLGIALSLALVQNMNKVDKPTDKGEEEGEAEPNMIQKVKDAGVAGAISYALWELGFWSVSIPICVVGYNKFTGHWPDLSDKEDMQQLGGEIFAFVNVARLAVPLRIGLALSTAPWIDENVVQKFRKDNDDAQQQVAMEEVALEDQTFVEEGENSYGEMDLSNENEGYLEWSGDEWQQEEMNYEYEGNEDEWQEEMTYADGNAQDVSQWFDFEERLSNIEANAIRVASVLGTSQSEDANSETMAYLPGNGYLNYIDEYCEPGTRSSNCAGALKGYLDGLATTGAVASDREVITIVGYLDSLSSNTTPGGTSRTGAAFTTYLDALSSGTAPSPPSAKAVAGYLNDLTVSSPDGSVGTRVVDIEGRLNKLESSISSLPDDIASRIINWQDSQDKKMSEELDKIKKMLEDVKS